MTYAVIFTRNDGWTGVTTIEAIQPTYDKAMVEAEKQVKDIMKTQHLMGSVQDNIKNGENVTIESEEGDWFKISVPYEGFVMKQFVEVR